nr:uncharacterized protein LOC121502275 [Drosophila kikkawai]
MRNFMSRRKNFVGENRETQRFSEVFEPAKIQCDLSSKGVEWIFNCPANPEEGAWERMIQCVKKVLAHTMKELAPKEHVLENLLIEAESIVNSRPLTHLTVTVDQEAPPPKDLLKGRDGCMSTCRRLCAGRDGASTSSPFVEKIWCTYVIRPYHEE